MRRVLLFCAGLMIAVTLFVSGCAFAAPDDADAIKSVLLSQQAAWNKGDIDTFMRGYWKSPDVRFISGDKITTGWNETLARYYQRYPTRDRMGQLTFSDPDVTMLGPESALVVGRWKLLRSGDTPHGVFSLTFRKVDGNWVIVVDHTS
jgi:hypothetical protein